LIVAGEADLVHDERGPSGDRAENVVAGAELHAQVRGGLHRDRRAHQVVRVHQVLRLAALQHGQGGRAPRPRQPLAARRARLVPPLRGRPLLNNAEFGK
jgi:hypothetical protein